MLVILQRFISLVSEIDFVKVLLIFKEDDFSLKIWVELNLKIGHGKTVLKIVNSSVYVKLYL